MLRSPWLALFEALPASQLSSPGAETGWSGERNRNIFSGGQGMFITTVVLSLAVLSVEKCITDA